MIDQMLDACVSGDIKSFNLGLNFLLESKRKGWMTREIYNDAVQRAKLRRHDDVEAYLPLGKETL